MKYLAWLITIFVLVAGVFEIVAPDRVAGLRSLEASQIGLLIVAVIRIAIGVVLIMIAPASRAPKLLQLAGALFLGAGLATPFFGVERTRAVLQWEATKGLALIRLGGVVATALGAMLAFALTPRARDRSFT
jgi:drug/metabolite transporter (DMT)-like permease